MSDESWQISYDVVLIGEESFKTETLICFPGHTRVAPQRRLAPRSKQALSFDPNHEEYNTNCLAFFIVEIAIGFRTKSLALVADAFHYLNDIVAYAVSFAASYLQESGTHTIDFTYAFHRAELVALGLSIFLQSIERFVHPEVIDSPQLVLIVGCIGLALNILSAMVVHNHHHHHTPSPDLNLVELSSQRTSSVERLVSNPYPTYFPTHADHHHAKEPPPKNSGKNFGLLAVLIHLIGDAVNNIGVIIAAVILWKVDSPKKVYVDPAASTLISFIIFGSAIPITYKIGRILLDATPLHLDLLKIKEDLEKIPNVVEVHDLHVWHLSQSAILASLHVCVPSGLSLKDWEAAEQSLQHCFSEHGITHVTISPEIGKEGAESAPLYSENAVTTTCSTRDQFGCAIDGMKKRRANQAVDGTQPAV
ncbi:hypothetical protein Clacol_001438 [Clathrus columnatus]|uniref:Uncharacterized protein n=1 Tax=Clathrus columnatus TaxID=1419009 RepID=A0AAV5A1Z0_9AGAM|nr:hypothetical protein Clacol_001438 [Clathrus columnatus]